MMVMIAYVKLLKDQFAIKDNKVPLLNMQVFAKSNEKLREFLSKLL